MIAAVTLLLLAGLCSAVDGLGPPCSTTPGLPDDDELVRRGAVIGEVRIVSGDIFDAGDPRQDRRLYRLANRVHVVTRRPVIRRQLLFAPGDPYSPRLLAESERLLRSRRYLYDADIRPVAYRDNRVDVEVVTRDVWTLTARANIERLGGENGFVFELHDSNFLGTGKDLSLERDASVDRTENLFRYRDLNLFGSRLQALLLVSDNSDGYQRELRLGRPFYAVDVRRAWGVDLVAFDRIDPLYFRGEITDEFRHQKTWAEVWGGFSRGLRAGRARRWLAGLSWEEDRFSPAVGREPPSALPADRRLVYPWIGFESLRDRYLETRDLDRIGRTEDVELGHRIAARLGFSSTALGGDRDRWIFSAGLTSAARPRDGHLLLVAADAGGRWGGGSAENLRLGGRLRYYWRDWSRHVLFVELAADLARKLDREEQLLLGGDSGLRGYPLRYQEGDRRFLLTVEQRFYSRWQPLQLLDVGAAVFVDVGRSWFEGAPSDAGSGVLKDVGFGLRLSSSRSGRGGMIHLDVAFPLDGDPSIAGVQWLITSKETF